MIITILMKTVIIRINIGNIDDDYDDDYNNDDEIDDVHDTQHKYKYILGNSITWQKIYDRVDKTIK